MKALVKLKLKPVLLCILFSGLAAGSIAQDMNDQSELDKRVQKFLEEHRQEWNDLNVPFEDGQVLYDLIVDNNYQSALEIGTSTGHSTIWIAWALSKTGGKLITIEIDKERQKQAIENLEAAGLSDFVDFRLGNAHQLVKELEGPFDFVFSDADKDWYVQYFKDIDPKLEEGGRFTAHNVLQNMNGIQEYMDFVKKQQGYETIVDKSSSSGIAISLKK
ncbi:putative O-methyltransferase YrrM [Anseongella ginsenosidimutans]|uniref:Putative O-methyltransferase YrrM n=1 Tax=Anseongella ginsenosidimutans TaxID=496056 RepID=A0A4R3KTQ2_9SPHI|nr:class I SAM-dependent methyltransferase [Anseongella ginsenosidimutans]QEC53071.1 methyltransferase domain-containing protein [Anseongella ginsenosidimutans]TCS87685.1 putative O-methyltransferase YrrM [Anseongella ginsenosidimutans]